MMLLKDSTILCINGGLAVMAMSKPNTRVRVVSGSYARKLPGTIVYTYSAPILHNLKFNMFATIPIVPRDNESDKHGLPCA